MKWMRRTGNEERMGMMRNYYRIFCRKFWREQATWRLRSRWDNNIKTWACGLV